MAQWSEVVQILMNSRVHTASQVNPNLVKIQLETDKGRSQDVFVGFVDGALTFKSVICKLSEVNLDKLIQTDFVASVPYGLGSVGEFLALKHTQNIESVDIGELAGPIAQLAHYADFIESALSGGDVY